MCGALISASASAAMFSLSSSRMPVECSWIILKDVKEYFDWAWGLDNLDLEMWMRVYDFSESEYLVEHNFKLLPQDKGAQRKNPKHDVKFQAFFKLQASRSVHDPLITC